MDIERTRDRAPGYYLADRTFELPELKMLADAVAASRFITEKKSRTLLSKIGTLTNRYDALQLHRQVTVSDRVKAEREAGFYGIDTIFSCIDHNHQMSFHYSDWELIGSRKELVARHGGALYRVSPCELLWDSERYYLIAYAEREAAIRFYRVDKITDALELAVKTRTPEECRAAATALRDAGLPILLGHNRVQEARSTVDAIREVPGARVHLIGPLQSNKINHALSCVDAIESLDSPALAAKIDARASVRLPVFVEVNVSGEATKHGRAPSDVAALINAVEASAHLQLAGFMTIGLNSPVEADVRAAYARLRTIRGEAARELGVGEEALELSMGMSRDLEWAIAEGATIVRLGTAVFGERRLR
ncbi:MAG: alanine racemase [Pauljensenia sp.]